MPQTAFELGRVPMGDGQVVYPGSAQLSLWGGSY